MTQRSMFDLPETRDVPESSREAYRDGVASGKINARADLVLRWLHDNKGATSAELAGPHADLALLMYVRRGLSDLLKARAVRKGADRVCAVTGRKCNTWEAV